jgi:hypothetical protein
MNELFSDFQFNLNSDTKYNPASSSTHSFISDLLPSRQTPKNTKSRKKKRSSQRNSVQNLETEKGKQKETLDSLELLPNEEHEDSEAEPEQFSKLTRVPVKLSNHAEDEEVDAFDYSSWLSQIRQTSLAKKSFQKQEHSANTELKALEEESELPQSEPIHLKGNAAEVFRSGMKFREVTIKNRDFTEFLNQIGGGLVTLGNGSEVKYYLPNRSSTQKRKPYKVYRIDFAHNGKLGISPYALWKFFGLALVDSGLSQPGVVILD